MNRYFPVLQSRSPALFDEDFDLPPAHVVAPEPEIIEPVFTAADVEAARDAAWRDGHDTATAEMTASTTEAARQVLVQIAAQLDAACNEASTMAERSAEAIARLLMDAFAATFPALCARHGEGEIRAVVRAILPALHHEPCVTIRLEPQSASAVADEIEHLDPDLLTRVEVVSTATMTAGAVRIAWRNGSAVRDTATLWQDVTAILAPAGLLPSHQVGLKEIELAE